MKKYFITLFLFAALSLTSTVYAADLDYRDGYLDRYPNNYTVSPNVKAIYDNDLSDNSRYSLNYKESITISIKDPVEVEVIGYFIRHYGWSLRVEFFEDGQSTPFFTKDTRYTNATSYIVNLGHKKKLSKIVLTGINGSVALYEFDFFINELVEMIDNFSLTSTHNTITATWTLPNNLKALKLFLNGQFITQNYGSGSYTFTNLSPSTEYEVGLSTVKIIDGDEKESIRKTIIIKTMDTPLPPGNVKNLIAQQVDNAVKLSFDFPDDIDFKYVRIYRNGLLIKDNYTENTFIDENVTLNKEYVYKVVSVDSENLSSDGAEVSINLMSKEVTNLKAKVDMDRVDLNWKNPDRHDFEFVRIYRKKEQQTSNGFKIFGSFFDVAYADSDGYSAIFETNGSYFNDLTVEPQTKYSYKLTTFINSKESDGTKIEVQTLPVYVKDTDIKKDGNGDYKLTWTKPAKGKIKIVIGGKDYKIVDASLKEYVIPAKDMKFTLLGDPDVTLIPLDENGNEIGVPTKPGTGNGGGIIGDIIGGGLERSDLTPGNLLLIGVSLLGLVGAFVLLGLAFKVVPKLIGIINDALRGKELKGGR